MAEDYQGPTPPPELVQQLRNEAPHGIRDAGVTRELHLIHAAYRAGADQELEACCEWLGDHNWRSVGPALRAARRPKPKLPSLSEQGLEALESMQVDPVKINGVILNAAVIYKYDTIRRALELLQSYEKGEPNE